MKEENKVNLQETIEQLNESIKENNKVMMELRVTLKDKEA